MWMQFTVLEDRETPFCGMFRYAIRESCGAVKAVLDVMWSR